VAKFSLRRYEDQAWFSVLLSSVSIPPFIAMAGFILKNMDWQEKMLYYGSRGRAGILLCAVLALMLSSIGFGFGLNSAGQRRNEKQRLSWIGFFLGALVLTLTLVVLAGFYWRGEPVIPTKN
jgi:hypothetical protein